MRYSRLYRKRIKLGEGKTPALPLIKHLAILSGKLLAFDCLNLIKEYIESNFGLLSKYENYNFNQGREWHIITINRICAELLSDAFYFDDIDIRRVEHVYNLILSLEKLV